MNRPSIVDYGETLDYSNHLDKYADYLEKKVSSLQDEVIEHLRAKLEVLEKEAS